MSKQKKKQKKSINVGIASVKTTFNNTTNTLAVTNITGNGSGLTSITGANVTGQVANSLVAGTVYTNAQPNITSIGNLTSLTVTGNLISGNANLGNLVTANYVNVSGNINVVNTHSDAKVETKKSNS